ncbi:midasin [Lactarius vividus]|nr:midasin [Lactarius vividus]
MSLTKNIRDPLTLDLRSQWLDFASKYPAWTVHSQVNLADASPKELLLLASKFLLIPAYTTIIADTFRPLLLDLCARWLENSDELEDKLCAFCLLLQPHVEIFPILSVFLQEYINNTGPLSTVIGSAPLEAVSPSRLHRLLLAYYRILVANPELPNWLDWPLEHFSGLFWTPHPDAGVRYLAIRCYALQSGMSELEREKLENTLVGSMATAECPLEFGVDVCERVITVDGWLLPVIEMQRIYDARGAIAADTRDFSMGQSDTFIQPSDLSPLIANIHGVLLFRRHAVPASSAPPLVCTNTTINSLRTLALLVSLRLPVLLTAPSSSGKILLLSYLASKLYPNVKNQLVIINLADTSMDARSLLGSYVHSTRSLGTFEWREGVLVRAMRTGRWVVFQDVDKGSNEVLGTIKPLVESMGIGKWIGGRAKLSVPSREELVAAESFAIFATRSLPISNGHPTTPSFFGAHKFHEVIVPSPGQEELCDIVSGLFPRLSGATAWGITTLWGAIKTIESTTSDRNINLRDLRKYCSRLDALLPSVYRPMDVNVPHTEIGQSGQLVSVFPSPTLREEMFLEARDVFFGVGSLTASSRTFNVAIATVIAEHLGLAQEKCDWLLHQYVPEFVNEPDANGCTAALRLGRVKLSARIDKTTVTLAPPLRPFAMHRPAINLMSRIAMCVSKGEPVLLTGETGTGKTSVVTHLASLLRVPLISLNLSQQTESSDLLGSFKPIDARVPGSELQLRFLDLFRSTFSQKKNLKFQESTWKAVKEGKWKRATGLWRESVRLAMDKIRERLGEDVRGERSDSEAPRKRRRTGAAHFQESERNWTTFEQDVLQFETQYVTKKGKFAFGFVEGPLVKALRSGDWILLDEINLASPETLESVSTLLRDPVSSITLTEQGFMEPVPRHPDFRLFACMNPATDAGKKDLPPNIRSYFTEIDVPPPDADRETLLAIITQYIGPSAVSDKAAIMDVAEFYSAVKALSVDRRIADGSNRCPHFNLRTLTRALTFAAGIASAFSLRRALWEGCLMTFTMALDVPSAKLVTSLAQRHLLNGVRNVRLLLTKEPAPPRSRPLGDFVKLGPFYLERGNLDELPTDDYIITPSVERKLIDLARIISTRMFPVLIEGPTSSGKTSTIEFLAKRTGHRFIRINNHEHTDIQEYLGTYVSDPVSGKLVFKDGLLVQALRQGDWIVLDELNLAPTDILEALNRLLDDNREIFIPETQEVIKPHPHFILFATQNPPGLYPGRKVLSRAFRSRFLEVHFEDIPQAELETILCQRCRIAPSYAQRIVTVFRELQKLRQSSRVFESKQGFATLRDLFRWAGRDAVGYQELAENGYMLLAERARREDDKAVVKSVIESIMKVHIDETTLYSFDRFKGITTGFLDFDVPSSSNIVWTKAMQRLMVLVGRALLFKEPILLVGETGSGKTSICQVYADAVNKHLLALNCHQNTETADLIGGLRPIRNKGAIETEAFSEASSLLLQCGMSGVPNDAASLLAAVDHLVKSQLVSPDKAQDVKRRLQRINAIFEWHNGPLVEAMENGDVLLLDEISLADDSVLERLNSVLEPARVVVLAEKGGDDVEGSLLQAVPGFRLVATMNPGGDYGKKELSPALRNRFTEIWVPPVNERADIAQIVASSWRHESLQPYTNLVLNFIEWLSLHVSEPSLFGLRDILAWVTFSNSVLDNTTLKTMALDEIFHHAAHMACLDGLGSLPALSGFSSAALRKVRDDALSMLQKMVPIGSDGPSVYSPTHNVDTYAQLGTFAIPRGPKKPVRHTYNIQAPTTRDNIMRLLRASQLTKPILLEGSPGVGKTSLVTTLANICGYHLYRINFSDQTDLTDLFGADLPVDGGCPGEFAWKEAEFLKAMQEGHWVLLDEMNLAPQSVLEGLNAVLDHRGTVYVPELGRSFSRHPSFRIFAAQNPIQQGGGRKGLPKSYVNRFTKVYIDPLTTADLLLISKHAFPDYPEGWLKPMITYNSLLETETVLKRSFGRDGSPWEFNLRDIFRWGALLCGTDAPLHPVEHLRTVYLARFRTDSDRESARTLFNSTFNLSSEFLSNAPHPFISSSNVQVGHFVEGRRQSFRSLLRPGVVLQAHLPWIEATGLALQKGWLVIVSGAPESGKTSLVRVVAELTGNALQELSVNHATDTSDILGSYEQVDANFRALALVRRVLQLVETISRTFDGCRRHNLSNLGQLRAAITTPPPIEALPDLLRATLGFMESLLIPDDLCIQEKLDLQKELRAELATSRIVGKFEWIDGPLVKALKEGHWLLLDNANLCSPSVLDRLNSLCEPSGVLTLNERGHVDGVTPVIVPHPNFRLVMCVDPRLGELSRAMRNRGTEISLSPRRNYEDRLRLQEFHFLPPPRSVDAGFMSTVDFEVVRRCLQNLPPAELCASWPPATVISGDSSASAVVDRVASIFPRDAPTLGSLPLAALNVFVRSIIPAYTSHLSRYISWLYSSDRTGAFRHLHLVLDLARGDPIWLQLGPSRQRIWPASSVLCPTQPMDSFTKTATFRDPLKEPDYNAARNAILRTYELFVKMKVYDGFGERSSLHLDAGGDTKMDSPSHPVLACIDEFVRSANEHGMKLLRGIPEDFNQHSSAEIQIIIDLLKYTAFLRPHLDVTIDFSLLQAVVSWIQETLRSAPVHISGITQSAALLFNSVSPTSGFGLTDIWSSWRGSENLNSSPPEIVQVIPCVDDDGDEYKTGRLLKATTSTGPSSKDVLVSTGQHFCQPPAPKNEALRINRISVIKELAILAHMHDEYSLTVLGQLIDLGRSDCPMSLRRFIQYQHTIRTAKSRNIGDAGIILSAFGSWMQGLWDHGGPDGPSILFRPTELLATVDACNWRGVTLRTASGYRIALEHHARLFAVAGGWGSTRIEDLMTLLHKTLVLLAFCFHHSFDESTLRGLQAARDGFQPFSQILSLLMRSSHKWLTSSVDRFLSGGTGQPCPSDGSRTTDIRALGHSWIALSRLFTDLYIPDAPLDPVAMQSARSDFWNTELVSLSHEIGLEATQEHRITGNISNGTIDFLDEQIKHVREQLSNLQQVPSRVGRSILRLREFWSEVSQFMSNIVPESRLNHLLGAINAKSSGALESEHVIQEAISGFARRLERVYPEYRDIGEPLQSALLYLRLGLRLVAHASVCEEGTAIRNLTHALTAFPSVAGAPSLITANIKGDVHAAEWSPFESILLVLAAIAFEAELGISVQSCIVAMENVYAKAVRLWLIEQKKREEADAASQSLYRESRTNHVSIHESELEEEEFLALFPDYEALLDSAHDHESPAGGRARHSLPQDQSRRNTFVLLHLGILIPESYPSSALTHMSDLRTMFLTAILDKHQYHLPETLDRRTIPYQLSLLAARHRDLHHLNDVLRPYNFYVDSHVPEIRRATAAVESLKQRLEVLIQEWPDQMVLHHLNGRCTQILNLGVQSPLAKVLVILETLLLQTDDWEMYANRQNTLQNHRQSLTELIISWRRLELSSWRGLLRTETIAFEEGVSEWWFRLYDSTVRGVLEIVERNRSVGLDDYLDHLVPLLDSYLKSSPLGQFSRRLDLLRSFGLFLRHLSHTKSEQAREPLHRVQRIVQSTEAYYSQFLSPITSSLTSQERAVEAEIQGFIKIASWKDVNVQALRASAKKTHHQLYKVIRKYRDIMRQPVNDLLRPEPALHTETLLEANTPPSSPPPFPVDSSLHSHATLSDGPAHLRDLRKTYAKFDSLIVERINPFFKSRPSCNLDDLTVQILSTAKELSSVSIPAGSTAERRLKLWKALMVRKRKAWSDFAKELKRAGLSTSVRSTVLLQHKNDRWLREQPFPVTADFHHASVRSSEKYFVRLQGLFPKLRVSLADHHEDVSTQELQRSIMLLESALSLSLSCRSELATSLDEYARLKCVSRRLNSLYQCSVISTSGLSISHTVSGTEDTLSRMCSAISETMGKVKELGDLPGVPPVPMALLENAQALLLATKDHRDALQSIGKKLNETTPPILLRDEYDVVISAQGHITNTQDVLLVWERDYPQLKYIILPLMDWLVSQKLGGFPGKQLSNATDLNTDQVIEELLKSIQSILSAIPTDPFPVPNQDNYIKDASWLHSRIGSILRVGSKVALLNSLIEQLAGHPPEDVKTNISRLLPFVQRYALLVGEQVSGTAKWLNSLFKLQLAACSVMLNIATNGFCKPPGDEDSGEVGREDEGTDGVGFGEGAGNENVSKDVEDESQVEGLQNESGEANKEMDQDKEDDAIEIDDDFQGELENLPDTGPEDEEKAVDDDEEDIEERLGDLDVGDPDTIDEKLWGDETGPRDDNRQGKANDQHTTEPSTNSEVAAKENETAPGDNPSQHNEESNEDNEVESKGEAAPEDEDNSEPSPVKDGAPLDDFVQNADTLDLPEDLNLEDDSRQSVSEDVDDDELGHGLDLTSTSSKDGDEAGPDIVPETSSHAIDETTDVESLDGQRLEGSEGEAEPDHPYSDEDVVMQPDVQAGDGAGAEAVPDSVPNSNIREANFESQSEAVQGAKASSKNDKARYDHVNADDARLDTTATENIVGGSASAGTEAGTVPSLEPIPQTKPPDPSRGRGDAFEDIMRHSGDILESNSSPAFQATDIEASQFQYVHEDDTVHDMQALGPSVVEEAAKLRELCFMDDVDDPVSANQMQVDEQEHAVPPIESTPSISFPTESPEQTLQEGVHRALSRHDLQSRKSTQDADMSSERDVRNIEADTELPDAEHVEVTLRQWLAEGQPSEDAHRLWRMYESLTEDLSYVLCEQLRLILEPTLATRLRGDYRTGKRLNMKKIIPYIASEYTKDKIWLRRTRPSQREYQVFVVLDDSRSMAESHSIHLAYETLALVSKALSRLEVGDIAIAKFGETVDVLHGFNVGPFTDQAGVQVMSAFTFTQNATNVSALIEASLGILQAARESRSTGFSSASDLWQLQIIISDGLCQDHEKLRAMLRRAEEQCIVMVFIIIDSLHSKVTPPGVKSMSEAAGASQNSILSMNQVAYKSVDGRMELQMQRYMDTFPFDYYVILRDVEALPEVLSGTLKQFFESISDV